MSRRQRINVPGGTYYVVQQCAARQLVFSKPEDYALFEDLLACTLRHSGARVHAYCWMPDTVHLVLKMGETSTGRFMQRLTSRYASSVHRRDGESGPLFRTRYQAVLIDEEAYLLKLVHYVHHLPQLAGIELDIDAYPHSSHRAYLGVADMLWLNTRATLRTFEGDADPQRAYREFMNRVPSPYDIGLFKVNRSRDRVIGSPDFMARLPRYARTYRSKMTLEQIMYMVTAALGVELKDVISNSRSRNLVLARALITWLAVERRVATMSEVACRLNRHASSLSDAISHHRELRPDLFKLNSLHYLTPVGPTDVVKATNESSLMKRLAIGG